MIPKLTLLGTALALACAAQAQGQRQAEAPRAQPQPLANVEVTSAEVEFLQRAVASNATEVEAAQLALQRSDAAGVRALAERLLQDHRAANVRLQQIAQARGVRLAARPSHHQRALLDGLQGLRGNAFERAFLERIGMASHQEAIRLYLAFLERPTQDQALRDHAREALPKLRQHLAMAQGLHARAAELAPKADTAAVPLPPRGS